jgi:glycine C-acetyltransferase
MCANNYLGLSSHPEVVQAAKDTLDTHGFGMSSVRFICGTQDIHKTLERKIAEFYGTEDTILYAAAFDANGGLFEPLFSEEDALIIVTDGVFSMDGDIALMDKICDLADKYDALVMTDECHSAGFIGKTGRGVPEYCGVMDRVDIITGTLGKALGGAMGGYTTGSKEVIEMLRQRSRPYLFSNSLSPAIVGASIKVFEILSSNTELRDKLERNTLYFKEKIIAAGFDIKKGDSPIVPIMLYDAALSQNFANELLKEGVYAIGFFYPVVAKDQARIRTQVSAAHSIADLDKAIAAFIKVGKKLNVI